MPKQLRCYDETVFRYSAGKSRVVEMNFSSGDKWVVKLSKDKQTDQLSRFMLVESVNGQVCEGPSIKMVGSSYEELDAIDTEKLLVAGKRIRFEGYSSPGKLVSFYDYKKPEKKSRVVNKTKRTQAQVDTKFTSSYA